MALSSIAVDQTKAMEQSMSCCRKLLDCLLGHLGAKIHFHASVMILNIHSDTSYLSEEEARSCTCVHFFKGCMPKDGTPICLNGAFHINSTILKFVVASATKAGLGALYHNCQTGIIFWLTLTDMGHPQSKTPVYCDNATMVGIANNIIKRQRSWSMEIRFFLDWGQSCTGNVYTLLAPWTGKPDQLPKQAPCEFAPCHSETLVVTFKKIPPDITLGRET